jgi:hypothetical protein
LAHERIAQEEALRRLESEAQTIRKAIEATQDELIRERAVRQKAEHDRDRAIASRNEAEIRIRDIIGATSAPQDVRSSRVGSTAPPSPAQGEQEEIRASTSARPRAKKPRTTALATNTDSDDAKARRGRRRSKVAKTESEIVEWWVPGWQEKFS